MTDTLYNNYLTILKHELKPALGCTEPIAIAYAGAKVREILRDMPDAIIVRCSGNIVKNVKGVIVPNSGGQRGIAVAATLGVIGGDPTKLLNVLEGITEEDRQQTRQLLSSCFCTSILATEVPALYIQIHAVKGDHNATITIENYHTNITFMQRDGKILLQQEHEAPQAPSNEVDMRKDLSIANIIDFADTVEIKDVQEVLEQQIACNEAIASEGLNNNYGIGVGRTLLKRYDRQDVRIRARAKAAAGSDARMSGCSLPVVINSGSGNQGITVSLPVVEFARDLGATHEQLLRALTVANLTAIHQKRYIGSLSAFCGAVSAATGAASGISYLHGGRYDEISNTIIDTLANVGGIVCDGAKPSCAAKISSALDAAILGFEMGTGEGRAFNNGEGLVKQDVEETIRSFGRMGKEGMKTTDLEILNIMME